MMLDVGCPILRHVLPCSRAHPQDYDQDHIYKLAGTKDPSLGMTEYPDATPMSELKSAAIRMLPPRQEALKIIDTYFDFCVSAQSLAKKSCFANLTFTVALVRFAHPCWCGTALTHPLVTGRSLYLVQLLWIPCSLPPTTAMHLRYRPIISLLYTPSSLWVPYSTSIWNLIVKNTKCFDTGLANYFTFHGQRLPPQWTNWRPWSSSSACHGHLRIISTFRSTN